MNIFICNIVFSEAKCDSTIGKGVIEIAYVI